MATSELFEILLLLHDLIYPAMPIKAIVPKAMYATTYTSQSGHLIPMKNVIITASIKPTTAIKVKITLVRSFII
jgi:hypothetical protein